MGRLIDADALKAKLMGYYRDSDRLCNELSCIVNAQPTMGNDLISRKKLRKTVLSAERYFKTLDEPQAELLKWIVQKIDEAKGAE